MEPLPLLSLPQARISTLQELLQAIYSRPIPFSKASSFLIFSPPFPFWRVSLSRYFRFLVPVSACPSSSSAFLLGPFCRSSPSNSRSPRCTPPSSSPLGSSCLALTLSALESLNHLYQKLFSSWTWLLWPRSEVVSLHQSRCSPPWIALPLCQTAFTWFWVVLWGLLPWVSRAACLPWANLRVSTFCPSHPSLQRLRPLSYEQLAISYSFHRYF